MTIVFSGGTSRSPNSTRTLSVDINCVQNTQQEVKLSGRELRVLPEHVRKNGHLRILDLSHNVLGGMEENVVLELSALKNLMRLNLSVNEMKTLPLDFGSLPFLEVLCLAGNELECLADGIVNLHRLKRLHCDFNHLSSLPHDWSSLTTLTTLTLSNNRLDKLPTTVWTLQALEVLNLQRNRISTMDPLPEGAASRLKELRLAWNRLSGSLDLSPLLSLTHLDVSHNDLEELEISCLQKLESLLAGRNGLKGLGLDGTRLRSLLADGNELETVTCKHVPLYMETLDISHNAFQTLPEWIVEAKSLHTLSADHNQLNHVPKELFACCNLTDLKLNHNFVVELPDLSRQFPMKSLSMQYNKLEKLPDNFFWAFPCLDRLNLSYNCLQSLPQSCNTIINLKTLLLSGNQLKDLTNLSILLKNSRIESLHLSYNCIKELPHDFFESLHCLRTLSLSGNELENVSSQISKAHTLEKLYLHSNHLISIPKFIDSSNLQVLDLACNKIQQLELASIVPKELTYLDLSSNCNLQIDPMDFQHLCCQRSVAVVDVNCAGRQAPLVKDNPFKDTENSCPWILGFTESQDGNTRIYIEFQKDPSNGRQEALIALMELDDTWEVGQLRSVLPELLKAERECKESYPHFLKNALLSSVRYLRSRGYMKDLGITICHLSSSVGSPVTLRLGTIGRPSSCVLGRAGNVIVLAQRQEAPPFGAEEWISALQETEVCCNNYLSSSQSTPGPRGSWASIPEPEVRELVLSPQDKFLVFGDSTFSRTVPADEVCRQVQNTPSPVAAGKALSEMYSALSDGKRECIAVITLKSDSPPEEEVEKYRCWEFMLEQNHKLLFTKELETIHKTILHTGEQPAPAAADPSSCWYTTALSKYKCPLPSHRGRYYCYGNKIE